MLRTAALTLSLGLTFTVPAGAMGPTTLPSDPRLSVALETDQTFNGVTVSDGGRVFMPIQRSNPDKGLELGEAVGGTVKAYPDESWNSFAAGKDTTKSFVGVNAIRIGPDGDLWVVDTGKPSMADPALPGGPKVVVIALGTNTVKRIYPLSDSTTADSFVDDIRINGRHAYLTDAGKNAGLIVLDLDTGSQRRLLDGAPSTLQQPRVLMGEGKPLRDKKGAPVVVNADQLEVSPDGKTFYFQPCTGPLYRIDTALLDDPKANPADVAKGVSQYADTHSTGGSAIAADGTIYISDTEHSALLKIAPGGAISTVVQDPKLVWVDAMWIGKDGKLWIPASQRNRSAGMNNGKDEIKPPLQIFTMDIGAKPVRN